MFWPDTTSAADPEQRIRTIWEATYNDDHDTANHAVSEMLENGKMLKSDRADKSYEPTSLSLSQIRNVDLLNIPGNDCSHHNSSMNHPKP